MTDNNVMEDTIGKPVTTTHDPAGPDWLQIGSITLKDEEKSILYLPSCEVVDVNEIPESGISYFCKKCLNPKWKKKR